MLPHVTSRHTSRQCNCSHLMACFTHDLPSCKGHRRSRSVFHLHTLLHKVEVGNNNRRSFPVLVTRDSVPQLGGRKGPHGAHRVTCSNAAQGQGRLLQRRAAPRSCSSHKRTQLGRCMARSQGRTQHGCSSARGTSSCNHDARLMLPPCPRHKSPLCSAPADPGDQQLNTTRTSDD